MEWLLLVDVETQLTDCYHHSLDYTHHKWSITLGGVIIVSRCRDIAHWMLPPQSRLHTSPSAPLHLVEWLLLVDVETQHTDCYHHSLDYTHHKWIHYTWWRWLLLVDVETQLTDCCHHSLDYTHHKWSITLGGVIIVSRCRDTAHWLLPPQSRLHTSQVIHYTWWSDYC